MSLNRVDFGSCAEAIDRFCVAVGCNWQGLSKGMGRQPGFLSVIRSKGVVPVDIERQIFSYLIDEWPVGEPLPLVISDFCKTNAPIAHKKYVSKVAKGDPETSSKRPCITCTALFESEGPHNRMCNDCRKTTDPFGNAGFYTGTKKSVVKHG